jgi:rhodanese-related sulfurtransferase
MVMIYILAFMMMVVLPGCWQTERVDQEQRQVMTSPVLVVNVLDKNFYDDAHIKGSINVPYEKVDDFLAKTNKDTTLVFYCSNYMCTASHEAVKQARKLGFKDARVYSGGMAEWYQMRKNDPSFELVGTAKDKYLEIMLPKPQDDDVNLHTIDALELKKLMKEANLI